MRKSPVGRIRLVAAVAAAALLLSAFPAFASQQTEAPASFDAAAFEADNVVPGRLMVTTEAAGDMGWAAAVPANADSTQLASRVFSVEVSEGTELEIAAEIAAQSGVVAVEPSHLAELGAAPDDEYYDVQWSHQQANAEAAWDITTGSEDVTVAILDTGMDSDHPDISRVVDQVKFTMGELEDGVDGNNDRWDHGHGQHVGGITAADSDNGIGIAGVDWNAQILDLDIFDNEGPTTSADSVVAGISWAVENGADVLNLSLGSLGDCPIFYQEAIDEANAAGATLYASAMNNSSDQPHSPAACDGIMSVSASGPEQELAAYSNHGDWIDIGGPGGNIEPTQQFEAMIASTRNVANDTPEQAWVEGDEAYEYMQGTSMASPYVAGVGALIKSVNPDASPDEVYNCLLSTAENPDGEDETDAFGHGLINAAAAVEACADDGPEPPPEPEDPRRIYAGGDTEPVRQAVAASQAAFDEPGGTFEATHAVIARDDEYADALAGSVLSMATAPILYPGPRVACRTRLPVSSSAFSKKALTSTSSVALPRSPMSRSTTLKRLATTLSVSTGRLGQKQQKPSVTLPPACWMGSTASPSPRRLTGRTR